MDAMVGLIAASMSLSVLGILEQSRHLRNLSRIPIRIHVNGTRGKSGVTRLIAAGLRAGGIRTVAKTTGTLPRLILPDGREESVARVGRTNVIEQLHVISRAVREGAEALVIECMALQPALQSLCELKIVRSTHGVITNARADHIDVMGPTARHVASSLAGTVPRRGVLYTAEQKLLDVFTQSAADRQTRVVSVEDRDVRSVRPEELERFSYVEHAENVALALRVCTDLGVDRNVALQSMWTSAPDAGVMTVYEAIRREQSLLFVNGFAANDPESTGRIWEMILDRYGRLRRRVAVFNCRADRTDRSLQLAEACHKWSPADHYVIVGSATEVFRQRAVRCGIDASRITALESASSKAIVSVIERASGTRGLVVGMGNIASPGLDLVEYYRHRAVQTAVKEPCFAEAA